MPNDVEITKTRRRHRRRASRSRWGAAAVEFACVAPFLFMLVLAMTEFGRAMTVKHTLTMAAREGARESVLLGATTASVESVVEDYLATGGVSDEPTIVVSSDPTTALSGTLMTVSVSVPFQGISRMATTWFTNDFRIGGSSTMRKEGFD